MVIGIPLQSGRGTCFLRSSSRRSLVDVGHGLRRTYEFDQIGNRLRETRHVIGEADGNAAVTINGTPAARQGEWFSGSVGGNNASSPDWAAVTVEADKPGGAPDGTDLDESQAGHLYFPPAAETLIHDKDGNLDADARWDYRDAENRLTSMTTQPAAVAAGVPDVHIAHRYDAESRRIATAVTRDGQTTLTHYLWRGWTLLAEFTETDPANPATATSADPDDAWS